MKKRTIPLMISIGRNYLLFLLFMAFVSLSYVYAFQSITYTKFASKEVLEIVKKYIPGNAFILEAGTYDGKDTLLLHERWSQGKIFAFEPVPEIFQWMSKKTAHCANINRFCLALSDKTGPATLFLSTEVEDPDVPGQSSSLLPPKEHLTYSTVMFNQEIPILATTIDDWAKNNSIDHLDFLWLDLQGVELNVLKASPIILKTIKVILTEVNFVESYAGQYIYNDLKNWLEEQGFIMVAHDFPIPIPNDRWFGDALFVRKELVQ